MDQKLPPPRPITTPPLRVIERRAEAELSDHPRREIWLGLGVIAALLAVLLGWGLVARLDSGVYAPGQIVVAGNRQAVQHRDGGIVSELDAHEGDRVHAGQVLARLNTDELTANARAAADQVIELKAMQARLTAETRGAPTISFPPEFARLSGPDRVAADEAVRIQRREFETRAAALVTERAVLVQRERQLAEQMTGYHRQVDANDRQQSLIQEEIGGLQPLMTRGLVPATRMRSLERNAAELTGANGSYLAEIAKSDQEIGETRLRRTDLDRQRAEDVSKDYRDSAMQLSQAEPKLAALRQQIERATVRAPATGKVVGLTAYTVGGVVAPGQKLMDVVPEAEPLVIEARVKPTDVDDLKIGQTTEIRIPAFHDRGMPLLSGRISKVSADSFTDEKTGVSYFKIEATVPPSQLALIQRVRGAAAGLKPGLPVEVVVPLRKRTALDYLLEPLSSRVWKSFRQQ